jgi:hypothetical protein
MPTDSPNDTTDNYVGKDSYNPVRDTYPDGGQLSVNELMEWISVEVNARSG